MPLVFDNSIVLAWCLDDEDSPIANAVLRFIVEEGGVAPAIWWYELRNALIVNERRRRLDLADTHATLADLAGMKIVIDHDHNEEILLQMARRHGLSVYDAAYLEVAQRRLAPLATLDEKLRHAAVQEGIPLFEG